MHAAAVTNKREVDAEKKRLATKAAPAAADAGDSPKKRKANSSNDSVGSGSSGSRPLTSSRRTDHRLAASSGRYGANSTRGGGGGSGGAGDDGVAGMAVPALPSPERKSLGTSITSRLHGHIRGADSSHDSRVQDAGAVVSAAPIPSSSSSQRTSRREETKGDDDDAPDTSTRSATGRGAGGSGRGGEGEEQKDDDDDDGNDAGGRSGRAVAGHFVAPRAPRQASYSTSHLSSYSGGYVGGGDDEGEEEVIDMEDDDDHVDVLAAAAADDKGIGVRTALAVADSKGDGSRGKRGPDSKSHGSGGAGDDDDGGGPASRRRFPASEAKAGGRGDDAKLQPGSKGDAAESKGGAERAKMRPPLPAPIQTKAPYVVPASLSQRLAGNANGIGQTVPAAAEDGGGGVPAYSPSDAMGHIQLKSTQNSNAKSFSFPDPDTVEPDSNFVDSDWDRDNDDFAPEAPAAPAARRATGIAEKASAVQPDENWLTEDFDC